MADQRQFERAAAAAIQRPLLTRSAPWLGRLALGASGFILLMIAGKFIADPVGAAAQSGTHLDSAVAITNMRASFGAFPLGLALIAFASLTSRRLHLAGLSMVATVLACALSVRTYGILTDGTLAESRTVLLAEAVLLTLCLCAIVIALVSRVSRQ
jgi:uncharacterized membrane protein YhaH (DUF805 family)